jgi:hypothetical protein
MPLRILPVYTSVSARYSYSVDLEGTIFTLYFNFSDRESYWYMDIYSSDGETLILPRVKLVPGYLLLHQYKAISDLPKGDFILNDIEGDLMTENISFESFGTRYELVYIESTESIG